MSARVAVVDDNESMCRAMVRLLRLGGFEPVAFGSAEEALASEALHGAACVVVDVHLPGLNGFQLLERLSARGAAPPAIFVTASEEQHIHAEARRSGAALLTKPFSGHALLEAVCRVLGPGPTGNP